MVTYLTSTYLMLLEVCSTSLQNQRNETLIIKHNKQ